MINIKKKNVLNLSALYLEIPIILFLVLWCRWFIALIGIATILFIHLKYIKQKSHSEAIIKIPYKYLIIIAAIIILWCILGGQGNLYYQSSDWGARNAIFKDMIFKDIPITYGNDTFLSYYIGHWIVPMTFGKLLCLIGISQNIVWSISNIILLLWTSLGILLTFSLMIFHINITQNKYILLALIIFIFFSGLDVIGLLIRNTDFSTHLETWNIYYQFSSQTTQLFWVFNQAIPAWLGTILFISFNDIKLDAYFGILLILFCPLPLFGCFVIVVFKILFNYLLKKKTHVLIKDLLTIPNILGIFILAPILLTYIFSNTRSSGGQGMLFNLNIGGSSWYDWFMLVVFILVECGVYLFLVYKNNKKNYLFYAIAVALPFIAAFRFGTTNDFEMRASIPLLFCLMVLVIKEMIFHFQVKDKGVFISKKGLLILGCLSVGMFTPLTELYRGYHEVRNNHQINLTIENIQLDENSINFVAPNYSNTTFGKYIGK